MARTKENPETGMMLGLLAAAGVAIYGYYQGWFGGTTVVAAPVPSPSIGTSNPITNPATQIVNTPSTPPPLGTVVTTGNDVAAQLAAKYPFIIPDPSNVNGLGGALATAGYINLSYNISADGSSANPILQTIYLRPDIAAAINSDLSGRTSRAGSQQYDTLSQIKQVMSNANLSGLNGFSSGWGGYRM